MNLVDIQGLWVLKTFRCLYIKLQHVYCTKSITVVECHKYVFDRKDLMLSATCWR